MDALTLTQREDGKWFASPPFHARIEVDWDMWANDFDCARTLDLEAQNGDPVRYILQAQTDDVLVFARAPI